MTKSLNDLRDEAHANSKAHGFHEGLGKKILEAVRAHSNGHTVVHLDVIAQVLEELDANTQPVSAAVALMHSELSELLEDARHGHEPTTTWYERPDGTTTGISTSVQDAVDGDNVLYKPCGIPSELADLLIRAFDFAGLHEIDLDTAVSQKMAYNATRPHKHGGKKF